jgi:osmotically-inducible protein OsmY
VTGNLNSGRSRAAALLTACGLGAAAEYFLDPESGRRRRHLTRDRSLAMLRRSSRMTVRRGKYLKGTAEGLAYKAAHNVPVAKHTDPPDDATLAQKVESIALRAAHTPKGRVNINAERGVVYLRGQLDNTEQIEALVHATGEVEGVRGVKNLLHTA